MRWPVTTMVAVVCLAALCPMIGAQTSVTLIANRDSTIFSESDLLSNGAGSHIFAGKTVGGAVRRSLIRFDTLAIPAGSTVTSVQLRLRMSRTTAGTQSIAVHRLNADWGEGASDATGQEGGGELAQANDATWAYRFFNPAMPTMSPAWAVAGGDYAATASATASVGGVAFYTWGSTAGLVADVQAWVNNPAVNRGWIMIGNEVPIRTAKRFDSRTNETPANRPQLTIVYTPPAITGACCPVGGGCVLGTSVSCAAIGGTYQGDGTSCTPFPGPCPFPSGACCMNDTTCVVLTASECASMAGIWQGAQVACDPGICPLVLQPFVDELPRPGVAQPTTGLPGGAAHYDIPITQFTQRLHRDLPPTVVWGYAGSFPGPTIEASVAQPVTVRWINDLRDPMGDLRTQHYLGVDTCLHGPDMFGDAAPIVTHLHGGRVPADSDGYPEDLVFPGEQSSLYTYPNQQLPGTLWYHDHALGITRLNVYMGLAGFYLLRDAHEQGLGLPAGEFEVPLAIQDRSFHPDGRLQYPEMWHEHFFGDFILVNGKVWPYMNVKQGKYRFRILNGSGSRTYRLTLSDQAVMQQIGSDTGLLSSPSPTIDLLLQSGERADVIIDFAGYAPGTEIVLRNDAPSPYAGNPGGGEVMNVMKFIVTNEAGFTGAVPSTLRPVAPLLESDAIRERTFMLRKMFDACTGSMWMINDLPWHMVTERVRLGSAEVWSFVNPSLVSHPMHIHLVSFQILDRQNFTMVGNTVVPSGPRLPPPPAEQGWKDTVRCDPNQITRVVARFEDHLGFFPYHCHVLEHEDHEMMRQFRVVCPGDFNGNGEVTVQDIYDYLTAWQSSVNRCEGHPFYIAATEFTGNRCTTVQDLYDFLSAWNAPCQ